MASLIRIVGFCVLVLGLGFCLTNVTQSFGMTAKQTERVFLTAMVLDGTLVSLSILLCGSWTKFVSTPHLKGRAWSKLRERTHNFSRQAKRRVFVGVLCVVLLGMVVLPFLADENDTIHLVPASLGWGCTLVVMWHLLVSAIGYGRYVEFEREQLDEAERVRRREVDLKKLSDPPRVAS